MTLSDDDRRHVGAAWRLNAVPDPVPALWEPSGEGPDDETQRHFDAVARQAMTGALLTRASDVKPRATTWFWGGRIPMGKITVIDGWPSQGKSTLTMALAASASTGSPLPQDHARRLPMGIIILSAEDEAEDTIVPRLSAHGADLDRCYILDAVAPRGSEPKRLWSLPGDIDILEAAIEETSSGLVIIDPFLAYLHASSDSYKDQSVRGALHPLSDMAKRTGCAVVLVRHLTKSGAGGPAMTRGGGAMGIIGAARAGLLVATDPDDETEQTKILAVSKMNLGMRGDSLEFRLESSPMNGCAAIKWVRVSAHTAETALVDKPRD